MRPATKLLFGACLALAAGSANATVLRVPSERATIQEAVLAAAAGDTVLVAAGTYQELIRMKDGVILRSSDGPGVTFLDSPGLAEKPRDERVFECIDVGRSTVIEGFELRAGTVRGAGFHCERGSPTIRGNVIRGWGWGIHLRDSSNAIVEDNVIDDCRAFGISIFASSPIVRRNTFSANDPRAISIAGRKSQPVIGGSKKDANRIFGSRYAIFNESRNDIDATWNDWGWATTSEMERYPYPADISVIVDGNDLGDSHRGKGKVDYRHWILPTEAQAAGSRIAAATVPAEPGATADTAATGALPADPGRVGDAGAGAAPGAAATARWPWLVAGAVVVLLVMALVRGRKPSAGA